MTPGGLMPDLATAITTSLATALAILFAGIPKLIAFLLIPKAGINRGPANATAEVVKWLVRIAFVAIAFDALGLPAVSEAARALLLFIPNLVVALVILAIAGIAANFVAGV